MTILENLHALGVEYIRVGAGSYLSYLPSSLASSTKYYSSDYQL